MTYNLYEIIAMSSTDLTEWSADSVANILPDAGIEPCTRSLHIQSEKGSNLIWNKHKDSDEHEPEYEQSHNSSKPQSKGIMNEQHTR